jgi:signal transduction histidine kinase
MVKVDLRKIVGEVRDILRGLAAEKRIRLTIQVDTALGVVTIDPARFKQVLYNYLSNAIKLTPEQGCVDVLLVPDGADMFRTARDLAHRRPASHRFAWKLLADIKPHERHAAPATQLAVDRALASTRQRGGLSTVAPPRIWQPFGPSGDPARCSAYVSGDGFRRIAHV